MIRIATYKKRIAVTVDAVTAFVYARGMANTPNHLAPENCYVCGYPKGQHTDADRHSFWSNADAATDFANEPQVTADTEARYVGEHRPY
jgi:hypothetical protein